MMSSRELTEREKEILGLIIQNFILTASPVGSRYLAKHSDLGLSDATIRNVMADLEERGFIAQPHTSAGRLPTDKGYRFYVDTIMMVRSLSQPERRKIDRDIENIVKTAKGESSELLRETSRILGKLSQQLGFVLSPKLSAGVFEKLDIVSLSSNKIMVVLSIRSGFVKTIMLEVKSLVMQEKIDELVSNLNERLSGLTLEQIKYTFKERVAGFDDETGLLRVFIDSAERMFTDVPDMDRLHISGTENIIGQPEFGQPEKIRGIVEMTQNENVIVHLVEDAHQENYLASIKDGVKIIIGKENRDSKINDCSIVTAQYEVGDVLGTIGVIGPTRMDYAKVIRVIDYIAKRLSDKLTTLH
ncbi:heat-inducible transcription repressor HrcA [Chloroherpeton thalassium ATCC 35110]|uniref:Heat-inducible transcription repressor HrcA n=1 Tax=Chloroherpeton thalassium (strain ATCC 35110 / GB-78) TaxID=517418 RepID=B3QTT1_CHLT3|nr:heat-inducible transcriptional repressor HrcA [Chloroherpeton thalassium]ACF14279.1 heat-inducible transcription repressor HrcA [Chloroherpeton thalassium ATCC 35110]